MEIKLKLILVSPILIIVVFFLLYFRLQGISGGYILVCATTAIALMGMPLIIGLVTFSWKMKGKLSSLIGIVSSFILTFL